MKYEVTYTFCTDETIEVEAADTGEALEIAKQRIRPKSRRVVPVTDVHVRKVSER